jgi:hypothetical protein
MASKIKDKILYPYHLCRYFSEEQTLLSGIIITAILLEFPVGVIWQQI